MNAKEIKFLQLFENLVNKDYMSNPEALKASLKSFAVLDYKLALDVWEYLLVTHEAFLGESDAAEKLLCDTLFEFFYQRSGTKCIKAVQDNAVIRKSVYQYSTAAIKDARFSLFTDSLLSSKFTLCDDIIRSMSKSVRLSYGEYMKKTIDFIIVELLKKNPNKIEMNKKLKDYLTAAVSKIRTDERAMLEQRLREIA